jgi:hypothetical protein
MYKVMQKAILRIICFTLSMIVLGHSSLFAQDISKFIQLPQKDMGGKEVISLIEKNGTLQFTYGKEVSERLSKKLHFNDTRITVKQALEVLQKATGISYSLGGTSTVILKAGDLPLPLKKDGGKVTGKIIDEEDGQTVANASIQIGNKSVVANIDGSFSISLPAGNYEAEISSVGYGKKIVTEIEVGEGDFFELNVALKRQKGQLAGVIVKGSAKKEGVAALLIRQQNSVEISNGISSEQISATPDKNVGDVLKRISGVSTNDNRRVVIRGIAERYNVAMLDGVTLPSTDVQVRDFEFDIIPSNLVDNIVVSKSYTPDMSFGFGGGLVQINTLAIPVKNFVSINFGGKYNDVSTGKEFLGYKRGKTDYLGFDDGGRKDRYPKDLFFFSQDRYSPSRPYENITPPGAGITPITPQMIADQNKLVGGTERLGTRIYKARPSQNYQFSLGKSYALGKGRIGFVGSLSYRNEQMIDDILHFERGNWTKSGYNVYDAVTGKEQYETTSKQYNFTTTWAALVNGGWETKNNKIFSRNFYSRSFQSRFVRTAGWGNDIGYGEDPAILENDSPKFIELLQNKLTGEHKMGSFFLEWNLARNKISNNEYDAVEAWTMPEGTSNGKVYTYVPNSVTDPGVGSLNRAQYKYVEDNLMADAALSYNFKIASLSQKFKAGYQYLKRHGNYDWDILPIGSLNPGRFRGIPIQQWGQYMQFTDPLNDLYYYPGSFSLSRYEGKNTNEAFFGMMDNRFTSWLRLVWGLRVESYVYDEIADGVSKISNHIDQQREEKSRYVDPVTGELVHKYLNAATEETKWRYLPSANLTITPFKNFNIRAAYAESVVRPSLIENSGFSRLNPTIGRIQHNVGVLSTTIKHIDTKLEWYPSPGEVISVGYFYKHFTNPVELYLDITNSSQTIDALTGNSDWAKVRGWEFDLRKNLGFLYPSFKPLKNLYLSGNLTLQTSEVQASRFNYTSFGEGTMDKDGLSYSYREKVLLKEKRPLYGQVPVLYNVGLLYNADRLSLNVVFNHMGYKTFTVGMKPEFVEYERPRDQTDAQIAYAFLKKQTLKVKLNMSNLFDNPFRFYMNMGNTYKEKSNVGNIYGLTEWADRYEWKYGFSEKYEEGYYETSADGKTKTRIGDSDTYIRKVGRSISLSVAYTF